MEKWKEIGTPVAVSAAREGPAARRRWAGQNDYDADNMVTESTRFTLATDRQLRKCCQEAKVTRYALIAYLLQAWMAAWEAYKGQ